MVYFVLRCAVKVTSQPQTTSNQANSSAGHFPKAFICHTAEKHARTPFPCHTSIFIGLKVVCLPHIRKTNRVTPTIFLDGKPQTVNGLLGLPGRPVRSESWFHVEFSRRNFAPRFVPCRQGSSEL